MWSLPGQSGSSPAQMNSQLLSFLHENDLSNESDASGLTFRDILPTFEFCGAGGRGADAWTQGLTCCGMDLTRETGPPSGTANLGRL